MTDPTPHSLYIYKVADRALVEASTAAGHFLGAPIDQQDGYIHFSTAAQLGETLRLHFAGRSGLLVLSVPISALGAALRWEPSRGGQLFPHLYGELPMHLVTHQAPIDVAVDGSVELPEWVA